MEDSPNSFIQNNKFTVIIFLVGILLIGLGFLGIKFFQFSSTSPKVEILGAEDSPPTGGNTNSQKITVEASGEVLKPGVYILEIGSRINDLLIASGGISANADREWVSKNINLAAKLVDGAKVYVPKAGNMVGGIGEIREIAGKININSASESELDTLAGIGPVTAKKIIDGRPYQTTEELLSRKVINNGVWEKIKDGISVY